MSSYLLLRNNKESGPFSQEQLIELGLKPYDLVWAEGKSAAWRYPSEIAELKNYAPVVEEQPYDRFYKKPTIEQKELPVVVPQPVRTYEKPQETITRETIQEVPLQEEKYEQYMPKKSVNVIMPKQTPVMGNIRKEEPVYISVSSSATNVSQQSINVETKYSQPLDEIKDIYVKQLQQRKSNMARKKFITQTLKKAAVIVAIVGVGIAIGFAIKPKSNSTNTAAHSPAQDIYPANNQSQVQPEQSNVNTDSNALKNSMQLPVDNTSALINDAKQESTTISQNKSAVDKKKITEGKTENPDQQSTTATVGTITGERTKNLRSDNGATQINEKTSAVTEDLFRFVSVKNNDYKIGTFGGFHNLQLTVTNDSKYMLDNVIVEVQYLKLSEQVVKTEHLKFQFIEPGGSLTIRIPDNNRGAKLAYKVIKIQTKETNSNTAGL